MNENHSHAESQSPDSTGSRLLYPHQSLKKQRANKIGSVEFGLGLRYRDAHLSQIKFTSNIESLILGWMKNPKDMIVILANPGCGKTHFCAAILNLTYSLGFGVYYKTWRHFIQDVQNAISDNKNQYNAIQKLADQDFLILDDLGSSRITEWQQEIATELIEMRANSHMPTIVTSNLNEKMLEESLGNRLHSRLCNSKQNIVIQLWTDDMRKVYG